jgi:hypothetical protein
VTATAQHVVVKVTGKALPGRPCRPALVARINAGKSARVHPTCCSPSRCPAI